MCMQYAYVGSILVCMLVYVHMYSFIYLFNCLLFMYLFIHWFTYLFVFFCVRVWVRCVNVAICGQCLCNDVAAARIHRAIASSRYILSHCDRKSMRKSQLIVACSCFQGIAEYCRRHEILSGIFCFAFSGRFSTPEVFSPYLSHLQL